MKVIKDNSKIKVLQGTYLEFVEYAKTQPRSKRAESEDSLDSERGSLKFTATKNIDEALNYAEKGWDSGIKQLKLSEGVLVSGKGMEVNQNVLGSLVNIGNYVQGLPDNMYEFTELRDYNLEPLNVYVRLNYSARNSSEKALKYTKFLIEKINDYQRTNAIKIIGFFDSDQNSKRLLTEVLIKDLDEKMVINNISFAFHPSFFRRLYFKHIESEEFLDYFGYGRPCSRDKTLSYLKSKESQFVFLPNLNDLADDFTEEQFNSNILENA